MIKSLAVSLSIALSSHACATASGDLSDFFNKLGYSTNVTGAHSYESQAAGFASLGSVYARTQVRSIQLAHVDVPGMRSGCGGIDITAGGFSFIKVDANSGFHAEYLKQWRGLCLKPGFRNGITRNRPFHAIHAKAC